MRVLPRGILLIGRLHFVFCGLFLLFFQAYLLILFLSFSGVMLTSARAIL